MPAAVIPLATERRSGRNRRTQPSDRRRRTPFDGLCIGADYSPEEMDFLKAVQAWKANRRCPRPSWEEVVLLLHVLGYRLTPPADSLEKEVLGLSEAIQQYMRRHRRMFPTHTEVLAVAKSFGYLRTAPAR